MSKRQGINIFNGKDYVQFSHDIKDTTALPDDYINVLHRDKKGRMWVGTQNGLARYEGNYRFHRFSLPDNNENFSPNCSLKLASCLIHSCNPIIFIYFRSDDAKIRNKYHITKHLYFFVPPYVLSLIPTSIALPLNLPHSP